MTRWKDLLPEYDPGKGSWERLEKSLYFEEQLGRELPNLPSHEPRDNTWTEIASRLPGRGRALKPTPVRRLRLYYSAAAAAVLIAALSAIFLLTQRGPFSNDQPPRQIALRKTSPSRDTAGGNAVRPIDPVQPTGPVRRIDPVQPAGPAENVTELAGGTKQAEKAPGFPYKTPRAANRGLVEVNRTRLPGNTRPKPNENSQATARPIGLPQDSTRLIADAGLKQDAAPRQDTGSKPTAGTKLEAGHHRVIQVQWKEPKRSSLKLAKLPVDAAGDKLETPHHLIQIKL